MALARLAGDRKVVDFGLEERAIVHARYQAGCFGSRIALLLPDGIQEVDLQVPGKHNVANAAASAAVAVAMGVGAAAITSGLSTFAGVKGRMQKKQGLHGSILIDDTYNANPDSVRAALAVLAEATGRKILVLGDMGELGAAARGFHERIGAEARAAGDRHAIGYGRVERLFGDAIRRRSQAFQKNRGADCRSPRSAGDWGHVADKRFALHANGAGGQAR